MQQSHILNIDISCFYNIKKVLSASIILSTLHSFLCCKIDPLKPFGSQMGWIIVHLFKPNSAEFGLNKCTIIQPIWLPNGFKGSILQHKKECKVERIIDAESTFLML